MSGRVCVWGAGAIGGIIGAHLARAGQDIVLVDVVGEHVDQIARSGLAIEGPLGGFSVEVAARTPNQLDGQFDTVLLAVKSQHTEAACRSLEPHLARDGCVVSCQNGLNEPTIAEVVGARRTVGAFVNFAGDYLAPGRITYGLRGTVAIGELDGTVTPRITALRDLLALFEPDTVISPNIFGFLWGKASYATVLTASALTHDPIADFIADPARRHLIRHLVGEILTVAAAEKVEPLGFDTFEPAAFVAQDDAAVNGTLDALAEFNRGTGKTHSGIWRDLAVRRRKTEVVAQLAPIQKAARRHGVALPLVDLLVGLIGDVEAGTREQGDALADELGELAASIYPERGLHRSRPSE